MGGKSGLRILQATKLIRDEIAPRRADSDVNCSAIPYTLMLSIQLSHQRLIHRRAYTLMRIVA